MSGTSIPTSLVYPPFPELLPDRVMQEGKYEVRFARGTQELDQLLRLRFEVFNLELGEGLESSLEIERDIDEFDPVCHHLIVLLRETGEVVGTYRLQTNEMSEAHSHGFYSKTFFDLNGFPTAVITSAVELGRACVALKHRNTQVLFLLWKGLMVYMRAAGRRYFFGCCSLTSQDPEEGRAVMDFLDKKGHVHPEFTVLPQPGVECYDRRAQPEKVFGRVKLPKLFRIYLRHGVKVCGPPAIDRQFKTIDYLVLFDVETMTDRQIRILG